MFVRKELLSERDGNTTTPYTWWRIGGRKSGRNFSLKEMETKQ